MPRLDMGVPTIGAPVVEEYTAVFQVRCPCGTSFQICGVPGSGCKCPGRECDKIFLVLGEPMFHTLPNGAPAVQMPLGMTTEAEFKANGPGAARRVIL